MRILHVVSAYYPAVRYGGPIRSVHGLAAALANRGHDVHVATTSIDGDGDLDVPLDRPVMLDGVSVRYFPVTGPRRLCWSTPLADWLDGNTAGFDFVHLHAVFLQPTWAGSRAARKAGVPYVVSPRGMLIGEVLRRKSRWVKSAWIRLIERDSLRHAAAVHVTADLEGDELKKLGLPVPRVWCVPNGVAWPDVPLPLERTPFASVPQPYALFLSRISWKKGLDRLIAAWQSVPDLHLVIAGNDDENYTPQLEALARSLGVSDRVHFVGAASDEHKWALYERAEMFILPSYSENFGNVVAEAMAMSCPIVLSPEVGIASIVRDAEAGIVTSNEPHALADAVRTLHEAPDLRLEMGRRGRGAVEDRLSWNAVAAQMETVYRASHSQEDPRGALQTRAV